MYALKSLPRNEELAMQLYCRAADLGHPEAMVQLAREFYLRIGDYYQKYTAMDRYYWKIPRECVNTSQEMHLREMWRWLEKSANLGWASYFLSDQAEHAEETRSWVLNDTVKRLLSKIKLEEQRM